MRTIEEVRSHLVTTLGNAVRRPMMYGGDGNGVYVVLHHMLHNHGRIIINFFLS